MQLPQPGEGLEVLPRRIFLEGNRKPDTDLDGFVRPWGEILKVEDLLGSPAVIAAAPPWTGKSYVAKELWTALKLRRDELPKSFHLPEHIERTCFEEAGEAIPPLWWDEWKTGTERACWIIDAVDEDDRRRTGHVNRILRLVEALPKSAHSRICLFFLVRLSEIPEAFEEALIKIFGTGLRRVRLAGLDRVAAETLVTSDRFADVCEIIRANNLQEVAAFPPVLKYLKDRLSSDLLTREEIWRGILKDLLREQPNRLRFSSSTEIEVEDRFEVAQRMAAVLTFSGDWEIGDSLNSGLPALEEMFPSTLSPPAEFRFLRQASREILKTAVFERSERGFRFAQDHVREWLTAFALQKMPLLKVRPLLTESEGEPVHQEIITLLGQISKDFEVRQWVLQEAIRRLDKLRALARTSLQGLSLPGKSLGLFQVPGMGAAIVQRLEESLEVNEQILLLEIADSTDALEGLPFATRLIQDSSRDPRLRSVATYYVARLGREEHLRLLAEWGIALGPKDIEQDPVLLNLALSFFRKGLWSFELAAGLILRQRGLAYDWLQGELAQDISMEQARWLLSQTLISVRELMHRPLGKKSIEVLLTQTSPSTEDLDLLVSVFQNWNSEDAGLRPAFDLYQALRQRQELRRRLFLAELEQDPEKKAQRSWVWASSLHGEDCEWLFHVIRKQGRESDWLWSALLRLSNWSSVPEEIRQQVRAEVGSKRPELLEGWDREREQMESIEQEERRRREQEQPPITYQLEPLVREALGSQIDLHEKMIRFSWWCFDRESQRPSNLSGDWKDLPGALRQQILEVCRQALAECSPTEIPDGQAYSSWISWEAACFDHLAQEDHDFELTPEMIQKWLPALLRVWASGSGYEATLRKCFEVAHHLTEDLLLEGVQREARSGSGSFYILHKVPPELWTERFSALLEGVVQNEETSHHASVDLLVRIGRLFPQRARTIALQWADGADEEPRYAGVDILLMVDPEEGWTRLRALAAEVGAPRIVHRMRSLLRNYGGPDARISSWPAALLEDLERLLYQAVCPDFDPEATSEIKIRRLDEDDDLRWLRDRIPALLLQRNLEGDLQSLERLAAEHPKIGEWLSRERIHEDAETILSSRSGGMEPNLSVSEMVKLLQESRYRLPGSADDLLDVLLEELHLIAKESGQHLPMLYYPRPAKGQKRKHLHEEALQAYIYARLRDRLPVVLGEEGLKITIDREVLAAKDTRNDIKVQAPGIYGTLTLIIEIKWSDNPDVSTNLINQLGEDYLVQNGHTHGIYLVGWSGEKTKKWKSPLGAPPDPPESLSAWQYALGEQAKLYHEQRSGLRIVPFVMDLSWG